MRFKGIYQKNIEDCAVACLLSIIKYYGGDNTYENIRYLTYCNNNGVTAYNLVSASKKLGFNARGLRLSINEIDNLKFPLIAHTINNGYNHFIIIKEVKKDNIIVFDPVRGNIKYSKKEFENIWSNVVIELVPNRKLDVILDNKINIFKDLIKTNIKTYMFIVITSIISIILTLLSNSYFKLLIDNENITYIFILFLIIIFIKEIFDYIRNKLLIKLESRIDKCITLSTNNILLNLPYNYFSSRAIGDVTSKIQDLSYLKELFVKIPVYILVDTILLILTSFILIKINLNLFIIFLLSSLLYMIVLVLFNNKNKYLVRITQETNSINNEILIENVKTINTIKNLSIIDYRKNIFENSYNRYIKYKEKYENTLLFEDIIKNVIILFGINIVLYCGVNKIRMGIITLSDLILFDSIMLYFFEALKNICDIDPLYKNAKNVLKRIEEIYKIKLDIYKKTDLDNYDVSIKDLTYSYDGYKNILSNINLDIKSGEKIVVTGSSGCGKSTLFKLINKTYQIDKNKIFISNNDISSIDTNDIILYVSQEEDLFKDTLYNNLTLGIDIDNNTISKIGKITGLNDMISKNKISLDSIILENGINLSKGERQKIILTRALLKNNKILILDEALNALDEDEECKILNNIIKKYKNNTIIYITHRNKCIPLFERNLKL